MDLAKRRSKQSDRQRDRQSGNRPGSRVIDGKTGEGIMDNWTCLSRMSRALRCNTASSRIPGRLVSYWGRHRQAPQQCDTHSNRSGCVPVRVWPAGQGQGCSHRAGGGGAGEVSLRNFPQPLPASRRGSMIVNLRHSSIDFWAPLPVCSRCCGAFVFWAPFGFPRLFDWLVCFVVGGALFVRAPWWLLRF